MHTDYTGLGVDQLQDCIDKIKSSPEDRRIIMTGQPRRFNLLRDRYTIYMRWVSLSILHFTAWNPADLDKMALPPCHMFCQFYVAGGELSCQASCCLFAVAIRTATVTAI